MASNLRVDTILPSTGTNVAIGTASGSVTFLGDTDITTSGSVSIGGTLTYEDVTNVDSVGVITARSAVSIADSIVHTGDTNTSLRFPSADTITAETAGLERFRISSDGKVGIGGVTPTRELTIYSPDSGSTYINLTNSTTGTTTGDGFGIGLGGDEVARLWNYENTRMEFATNSIERLRITSGGQLNLGGSSTQTTHLLHLQSTGDAGIHIRADSDNSGENDNPYVSMSQDGSAAQLLKLGLVGEAGQEFAQSIGNASFLHANANNAQPLQLAHMDNLAVTISNTEQTHFHTYSGNSVAGVKIANRGNDTAACLLLQGHNNTGTPGAATNFQLTHKGANATTNFRHLGTDRLVIGSNGVVSGDLNDTSDIALKKDIESISTSCIDNIKQLNPVTFKWKDTSRKDIGFIAQEVEVILPDLVNGEDGVKSINTIGLVSQLTKALQEAITEIETLKTKVAALKSS